MISRVWVVHGPPEFLAVFKTKALGARFLQAKGYVVRGYCWQRPEVEKGMADEYDAFLEQQAIREAL